MTSFVVTKCPIGRHFCFRNCDRLWPPDCRSPGIRNLRCPCYGIGRSVMKFRKISIKWHNSHTRTIICILTKNERLHCDASPACHKLKLPSPSAMPNLLPCCENLQRVTLANVPGGRGVQTTCWCPHSHICTEPSWPPVKYNGIWGCAHIRFILSILCFKTCDGEKMH